MQSLNAQVARVKPRQPAILAGERSLTYQELAEAVHIASRQLHDLAPRAVALDLPNSIAWVVAHLACLDAKIAQVPIPPFFTPEQRLHALQDAGVDWVISPYGAPGAVCFSIAATTFFAMKCTRAPVALPDNTALITYTSGSTGQPKGVCLSEEGMLRVAHSLVEILGQGLAARHLSVLPLAILLEQIGGLYTAFLAGGTYIISSIPAYGAGLVGALQQSRATSCILVPEMLKLLVLASQQGSRFPALRFAAVGGARVAERWLHEAERYGLPVYQGYGLSEAASVVAVNRPGHNQLGTVGQLLPHIRYSLAEDGEIILQDPAMLGYTGGAIWQGNYPTGDIGTVDADGILTIVGRKKDLLITGYGRNISPEWPESLLSAEPEIAQAMVYGDGDAALSALLVPAAVMMEAHMNEAVARVNGALPEYARIAHFRIVPPFTQANGLLTGTGRIRRQAIFQTFIKEESHEVLQPSCA